MIALYTLAIALYTLGWFVCAVVICRRVDDTPGFFAAYVALAWPVILPLWGAGVLIEAAARRLR